jgi:Mrp family chromosome partitioning ATPase
VSQVSGVVVVCRVGKTTRDAAKHLRDELLRLNAPSLGVVANDVRAKSRGYGYGYTGGYESKRASTKPGANAVERTGSEGGVAAGRESGEKVVRAAVPSRLGAIGRKSRPG